MGAVFAWEALRWPNVRTARHGVQLVPVANAANAANVGSRIERAQGGQQGQQEQRGQQGPGPNRADVLAMVEDQFGEIRKELGLQLVRMGQIQTQLDQIYTMVKKLVREPSGAEFHTKTPFRNSGHFAWPLCTLPALVGLAADDDHVHRISSRFVGRPKRKRPHGGIPALCHRATTC